MDFLDQKFASVNRAQYVAFLGLGNNKQKAQAQNVYEADIMNRFPFSDNCDEQKRIVQALQEESKATLDARNGAKKSSRARNDLTGKLRAFDSYIPAAIEHLNSVACRPRSTSSASQGVDSTNNPINSIKVGGAQQPGTGTAQAGSSADIKRYLIIGGGLLVAAAATLVIIHKLKKSA